MPGGTSGRYERPPARSVGRQLAEVKALACELPAVSETPLAKWSCPELAREAIDRGLVVSVSASTVRRWLAKDAIKPWQHRTWIFPRDPNFATKAARVLDLYQRLFDGQPLRADEYVISADEKPGVQARRRIHANVPAGPGRADAGRARIHPRRHPGLPGRLRRAPRPSVSADANPPPASSRSPPWSTRS